MLLAVLWRATESVRVLAMILSKRAKCTSGSHECSSVRGGREQGGPKAWMSDNGEEEGQGVVVNTSGTGVRIELLGLGPVSRTASLWLLSPYPGADSGVWDDDNNRVFEATDRLRLIGTKETHVDDCQRSSCFAPFMKANRWICLGQRRWQQDGRAGMRFTMVEH